MTSKKKKRRKYNEKGGGTWERKVQKSFNNCVLTQRMRCIRIDNNLFAHC